MTMYESLKEWLNIPAKIKPFQSISSTGEKVFSTPVDILCYIEPKISRVVDNRGTEVISNNIVYVDGTVNINSEDVLILDGTEYPIKALSSFFDKGKRSIWMVYI